MRLGIPNGMFDWNRDYCNEVFHVLIEVVKEHGVGDEGWRSARWEVYDTVSIQLTQSQKTGIKHKLILKTKLGN